MQSLAGSENKIASPFPAKGIANASQAYSYSAGAKISPRLIGQAPASYRIKSLESGGSYQIRRKQGPLIK